MNIDSLRTVDAADVYKDGRLAGGLDREGDDVVFRYHDAYRADPEAPPLSWSMPKNETGARATGASVPPFFAGLLPEGARLRAVVVGTKTSEDDHLTLLLAVGADTIGDVAVVPRGAPLEPPNAALDLSTADDVDLHEVFGRIVGPQSVSYDTVAIPGVQPKVSGAMISSPLMTTAGPVIIKLDPAEYPLLTRNEGFFLRMARACEVPVPEHLLIHDRNGRTGLVVHRFDRVATPSGPRPLAQEDACQVLGVYPARKYRLRTEDVVKALSERCEQGHGSRQAAALRLFQLVAFSYLIGNGDLHGKNFSIRCSDAGRWEPTPAYDLVSTQPYTGWSDPMALDLYGRANRLDHRHLTAAAERLGLAPRAVARMLHRMCDRAAAWIDRVDEIGFDPRTTSLLRDLIAERLRELTPS